MDEFFQKLRGIQKKERSLSGLSPVGDDFYKQISHYFNDLMEKIDNNPFSFESYLLRDAQRILAEICERREHKITNSVVMNVQRSYQIFRESNRNPRPKAPPNSTPEEEKLYLELFEVLAGYRKDLRSPLSIYSQNKQPKKVTTSKDKPSIDKVNVLKSFNSETKIKRDEIPLDIEDEIYKQFGREPKRDKETQDSRSNSLESNSRNSKITVNVDGLESEIKNNNKRFSEGKTSTELLMITEELPSIMGVDRKVYGPFFPGDVITMPEANARIIIKKHKGRSIQRYK